MPQWTCEFCGCVNDRPHKSNRQNRYFRGVLEPHVKKAIMRAGYGSFTLDEIHELIKNKFFSYVKHGRTFTHSTKNANYSTVEWESKIQEIRDWVYEKLDYDIPPPNEPDYNERK